MKNFLISGLRGNIGQNLKQILNSRGIRFYDYEKSKTKNFNRFVHLAAKHPIHTNKEIINSNIVYLNEIINNFDWKSKDLIFISTVSVYNTKKKIINESCTLQEKGIYPLSKIIGEDLILKSKINSLVLRVSGIISLKKSYSFLSKILDQLYADNDIYLSNGKSKFNSFLDPFDLSNFIISQKRIKKFDIVNLSAPYTHSLLDIVNMFKEALRSSSKIHNNEFNQKIPKVDIAKATKYYNFNPSSIIDTVDRITNKFIK